MDGKAKRDESTAPKTNVTVVKRPLTSTSSSPVTGPEVDRLTKDAFEKTSTYLKGQLEGTYCTV